MEEQYIIQTNEFNNKKRLYKVWTDKEFKQFQKKYNMEQKKKINWLRIWQIVRDILVAILTTDLITEKI